VPKNNLAKKWQQFATIHAIRLWSIIRLVNQIFAQNTLLLVNEKEAVCFFLHSYEFAKNGEKLKRSELT
jgi:hypothetical protein